MGPAPVQRSEALASHAQMRWCPPRSSSVSGTKACCSCHARCSSRRSVRHDGGYQTSRMSDGGSECCRSTCAGSLCVRSNRHALINAWFYVIQNLATDRNGLCMCYSRGHAARRCGRRVATAAVCAKMSREHERRRHMVTSCISRLRLCMFVWVLCELCEHMLACGAVLPVL